MSTRQPFKNANHALNTPNRRIEAVLGFFPGSATAENHRHSPHV
jgi:hypothetical protein